MKPIAGRPLIEWLELSTKDDCLEKMVPSDLRALVNRINTLEIALKKTISELKDISEELV